MKKKIRLDDAVVAQSNGSISKTYAQSLIMQGKIRVDDQIITKAGCQVSNDAHIVIHEAKKEYVCRAGYKLAHALDTFGIDVKGLMVLDAGLSTGGFTDCLLQRGVARVYGVDVGYGQVDYAIRTDPRVVVMERTNLRYLTELPEKVDLVTLDLSFISVLKVMDAVNAVTKPDAQMVVLIKPQFEAGRDQVGAGGIIRDSSVHVEVVRSVTKGIEEKGFIGKGVVESPIHGTSGNKEFLGYFVKVGE